MACESKTDCTCTASCSRHENAVNVLLITARAAKCLDAFFLQQVRKHMIDQLKTCIETDKITTKCFEQLSVNHYK